jgi:hypothetical protein
VLEIWSKNVLQVDHHAGSNSGFTQLRNMLAKAGSRTKVNLPDYPLLAPASFERLKDENY